MGLRLLKISLVYMLGGLIMGLVMGILKDFRLMSVHSHILLLGWLTMAAAGIIYILMPGCGGSLLARLHFWGHNIALPVMMLGLSLEAYGYKAAEKAVAAGSMLVLVSLALFAINVLKHGRPEQSS